MIIAVTSTGPTENDTVDRRFGRAGFFVFYDSDEDRYWKVDNSEARGEAQGAGITAGDRVFRQGAQVVITGHVGPKAFRVLQAGSIEVALCDEDISVKEAVEKYLGGDLRSADKPDVEGHWT